MLCRHWVNASWAKRPKGGAFLSPAVKRIAGRQQQSAGIDVRKAFIRHIYRFFDMQRVYDRELRELAKNVAGELGFELREGIYAYMSGPQYETPAEIRALKLMGANLVGMSTVAEVISAAQHEIRVLCISCVTNMAAGMTGAAITSEEVLDTTKLVHERFDRLVETVVKRM